MSSPAAAAGCATPRTNCPLGTDLARQVFSGGAEAEWCVRPDGARQGPETRFYESGAELRERRLRRRHAERCLALPFQRRPQLARRALGGRRAAADDRRSGGCAHEPRPSWRRSVRPPRASSSSPRTIRSPGAKTRETPGATFVSRFPNGRPRVAGSYDADGLRVGVWRTWFEDGRPALEIEYLGGVRERGAREWHPNGTPAAEGSYLGGLRDGRWRFWDERGPAHR